MYAVLNPVDLTLRIERPVIIDRRGDFAKRLITEDEDFCNICAKQIYYDLSSKLMTKQWNDARASPGVTTKSLNDTWLCRMLCIVLTHWWKLQLSYVLLWNRELGVRTRFAAVSVSYARALLC